MRKFSFSAVFFLAIQIMSAQEFSLEFYSDVMINADQPEHRIQAHTYFKEGINELLTTEGSFAYDLTNFPYISTEYAPDSSFKVITWELDKGEGDFEYYGYWQISSGELTPLPGKRGKYGRAETGAIPLATLPAGIIYRIDQLDQDQFLIYTYRQIDAFKRTKTIDIFNKSTLTLGETAYFPMPDGPQNRMTLEYSADSNAAFNYNPAMKMITFDNLVPMPGRLEGQGIAYVADGTYQAVVMDDDGKWNYQERLFEATLKRPTDNPRPTTSGKGLIKKQRN